MSQSHFFGVMWRKNEKSHVSSGGANEKGEPWFVGRDGARRLGGKNPQKAFCDQAEDEDKGVNEMVTP